MRVKINFKSVLVYLAYALALIALNCVLPGVPFPLALCFAFLVCGTNIVAVPLICVLCSAVTGDWVYILLTLSACLFLTLITLAYRRAKRCVRLEAGVYMLLALSPFVAFPRKAGTGGIYFTDNPYVIRAVAAAGVLIFAFFCFKSVYCLLFRLFRCKLKAEELLCLCAVFAVCGTGVCNALGEFAYICLSVGLTACAVRLVRGAGAIVAAIAFAVPHCVVSLTLTPLTALVLIAAFAVIFCGLGRFAPALSCAAGGAAGMYFYGLYFKGAGEAVAYTLLLILCAFLSALPRDKTIIKLWDMLEVKRVLPRTEEERIKEFVAGKLYKLSEAFREIESAFLSLDDGPDDAALKRRMLAELKRACCGACKNKKGCRQAAAHSGFAALVDLGCLKGRVSFVDLTAEVTLNCSNPTGVTENLNRLLAEYRRTTLEAENARNGRKLLAGQAKGIAEVLKERAALLCRVEDDFSELERAVEGELLKHGIACPEIAVKRGESFELFITLVDVKDISPVIAAAESVCRVKLMLKDKTVYDGRKTAYVFCSPPKYDAAFGVAFAVKDGERVSGDTHSVIKINEHSFLMALSDGMGSGEYAQRVSSTAISLIEAFYRAEMPAEIVLDTINKLLCFNRDERFTCIDAAEIDLNSLKACFIKIGSPVGIIVRKGEIKVLESRSLPLGILDSLHPSTSIETLKKNDIIVFMSDGVTSAFNGIGDLHEFIATLKPLNPQSLAEKILSAAKERVIGTPDDMTVLCVRIFERDG